MNAIVELMAIRTGCSRCPDRSSRRRGGRGGRRGSTRVAGRRWHISIIVRVQLNEKRRVCTRLHSAPTRPATPRLHGEAGGDAGASQQVLSPATTEGASRLRHLTHRTAHSLSFCWWRAAGRCTVVPRRHHPRRDHDIIPTTTLHP